MKERGVTFTGEEVRAFLAGTKTQMRRIIKPRHATNTGFEYVTFSRNNPDEFRNGWYDNFNNFYHCPYPIGTRIWVKETWHKCTTLNHGGYCYRADSSHALPVRWKPSTHMLRSSSRITQLVTDVRVQRVQDISEEDAMAEGVQLKVNANGYAMIDAGSSFSPLNYVEPGQECTRRAHFAALWDSYHGIGAWTLNQWVFAYTLKEVTI